MDWFEDKTAPPTAAETPSSGYFGADEDDVMNNIFGHYALVKAGLPNNQLANYSFYKNGEHIGTSTLTLSEQIAAGNFYDIGQDWSDDDYYSNNSEGFYGPTMHYTRALSHAEIRQNFNALRSRFDVCKRKEKYGRKCRAKNASH